MERGKIIFLNGLTSTGKTSVAKAMREMSDEVFYTLSNDTFHGMVSWKNFEGRYWQLVAHTITAQYYATRGMLEAGFNVIIDGMLLDLPEYAELFGKRHYDLFRDIFDGFELTTVDLVCPLDELRRRNIARGNRGENQSAEQNEMMTRPLTLDLTLDTSILTPKECASEILEYAKDKQSKLQQFQQISK